MYKPELKNTEPVEFVLDEFSRGYAQCVDNNWNYAIYARNPNVSIFQNEYNAGYIQGKVQGNKTIIAARNNTWRNFTLDATAGRELSCEIPPQGVEIAQAALAENYNYLYKWIGNRTDDAKTIGIKRMMFKMLGIYDGAADNPQRKDITYADLNLSAMPAEQSLMHVGDQQLTFIDIYFINAQMDLFDAVADKLGAQINLLELDDEKKKLSYRPSHCSAFVHMLDNGDIYWAHTSWACFYAMSCAVTYVVGDDFLTQNCYCQGQFGSNTDFGFNGHGIGFNETTETFFYNESKTAGVWLTWRAAAAENFARSIDEFWDYVTLDNTGTYLNGYMIVDAYRNEFALIDMSYARFAMMRGNGKELKVTDSTGYTPTFLDYDHNLVSSTHIVGCNIPTYKRIWHELQTIDGAPKRRYQLFTNMNRVTDLDAAKMLITFNSDNEPISIAGRWDYGYGTSEFLRARAHGAIDSKAFGTRQMRDVLDKISLEPDINGTKTSFEMKYGTPYISGRPFIWSKSLFAPFKQSSDIDCVPDALDGRWNPVKMFMK